MKIVVIGGTGLIGSRLVARLGEHGHDAVAAAPSTGVNTVTGEGVTEVLKGADVLVDVSNSPSFADEDVLAFFRTSTGNLVDAAKAAGVGHYVALTVVGTDRHPEVGYFRGKVAQEDLIIASGLPYSLVHATQFMEFAGGIADTSTRDGKVHLPSAGARPIAADDVVAAVGRTAAGTPIGGRLEIAGPEAYGLDEWIRIVLAARKDEREVVTDEQATYFGAVMTPDTLLPQQGAQFGETTLTDWLAR